MKVYIVQSCDYDDNTVWSVHASRETADAEKERREEEARAKARRRAAQWHDRNRITDEDLEKIIEQWRDHYTVSEWEVQP